MAPSLSLVIPVYNGGPYLEESLAAAWAWLEAWPQETELVVVEDGSGDGSRAILEGFAAGLDDLARARVQVLVNECNRGKGYSVRRGMLAARGALRVYLDADLAFPLANLPRLVAALEDGADLVLASRTHPDSEYLVRCDQVGYAKRRHLMGRVFNWLVRALVVDGFGDTQAGQKGLTAAAAERLFAQVRLERFAFDVELLWLAREAGLRIREVPVRFSFLEERTTVRFFTDTARMFRDLFLVRLRARQGPGAAAAPVAGARET